jgi:predicted signal transduction protein with EAL and GGDEF domain
MDNNIDFKNLWKQQAVSPPNIEDLFSKLKHFKKVSLRKLIITNVLLIATSVFILFIWYRYQPEFISTKIGIILVILAMVIYLFVYNRLAGFYKTIDGTLSNSGYLQKLISIKAKQHFLQSTMLSLYFIMLGLGLSLYMYEYVSRMTTFWGIFSYALTLGWIGFTWFYLRPKEIKKEQARVNDLIAKFEAVNKQLDAVE